MNGRNDAPPNSFTAALEAINNLATRELSELFNSGQVPAMMAHDEIERAPINQKSGIFYRHLVPVRNNLVSLIASTYRRCIKLALAHPRETGNYADHWAWYAIQRAIFTSIDWLRDWYILACDGENQSVRHIGQIPFVPGGTGSLSIPLTVPPVPPPKTWRAPAWLFQVSPTLGILLLRSEHVPANDSEEKLGAGHTRLLLNGARRSFLWELNAAIETVRNEEIAAAGAIRAEPVTGQPERPNKPKRLRKRDKQQMARDKLIAEIDEVAKTPAEFLQLMDERKVQPQPTWKGWPGSWVQAYKNSRLRKLIHQDKSRALSRVRPGNSK